MHIGQSYTPQNHLIKPQKTRSVILMNWNLPTNNWDGLNIESNDVTGVHLHRTFRTISIINVYNNCKNNGSLEVVEYFMRRRGNRGGGMHGRSGESGERGKTIGLGYFKRHHPMRDEEMNTHLFTKAVLDAAQPLLDMIIGYDMQMALPKDLPMLEACMTKNFTRVNNIFPQQDFTIHSFYVTVVTTKDRPYAHNHGDGD